MTFDIQFQPGARRDLDRLPEKAAIAVVEFIFGPLAENPHCVGKPLRFDLEGLHSARRGPYRVIHRIDATVNIIAIDHRADIYRP